MIYLNEWFPNPTGVDTKGEFIELYNSGSSPVSLNGWTIETEGKKKFSLNGSKIAAHGYLVLKHAQDKLLLKNTAGGLALYDASGRLADQGSFLGAAPEGQSYSRVNYLDADVEHFEFVTPTPGAANKTISNSLAVHAYPKGVALNAPLDTGGFFAIMMGTAVFLAGLIVYVINSHEDLSHAFFGRNEEIRREDRKELF